MASKRQVVLDLSDPKWIDHPEMLVERMLSGTEGDPEVDCSGLDGAPTELVQILLSARRSARARGADLKLHAPSQPFRDGLELLGLRADLLGGAI